MMSQPLNWDRDGADWPLRQHSRFITIGHLRWHIQRLGPPRDSCGPGQQPPRIWLLHGTGASTHTWRDLAPILAQHREVISIDLPGHAFTRGATDADLSLPGMAQALIALHEAIGPPGRNPSQDCWVGHSAGAAIALKVLHLRPEIVSAAVCLNGALLPWGGKAASVFMPLARALATHPLSSRFFIWSAQRAGTVDALLKDTGSSIDDRGRDLYERLAANEAHLRSVLRMMANWELEPFARELPLLPGDRIALISSAQDTTVPPSVSARAARLMAGSRLVSLPRWGHLGHEEAPAEWASLILQACGEAVEARGGVEPP